jgi:hypothetical protein
VKRIFFASLVFLLIEFNYSQLTFKEVPFFTNPPSEISLNNSNYYKKVPIKSQIETSSDSLEIGIIVIQFENKFKIDNPFSLINTSLHAAVAFMLTDHQSVVKPKNGFDTGNVFALLDRKLVLANFRKHFT